MSCTVCALTHTASNGTRNEVVFVYLVCELECGLQRDSNGVWDRTEDEFLKIAERKFGWVVGVGCVGG